MKKRTIYAAAAIMMATTAMAGCAKDDGGSTTEASVTTTANAETQTTAADETTTVADNSISAMEFSFLMGNGINLGNTMEAYGHISLGTKAAPTSYEVCWGMPVTTQAMITGMKDAGFDTLRIPVAWTNMMAYESGDYTIDEAYLARVKEIIDYAYNEDMYVIINDHWDGSWWGMFGSATPETVDKAWALYESMWTQISNYYADYDEHLIFESANEELGSRLNDKDVARDSGTLTETQCYEMANAINQKFVDVVRSTGGNNANRYLLIAGFNTDIDKTCDNRFQMPTDSANDKLMLSVHYYNPATYTLDNSTGNAWGTQNDVKAMNEQFAKMSKFTDAGIPVIIGEYGVLTDGTWERNNTVDYMTNLLNNCELYGMVPVLWDRNNMFDRSACDFRFEDVKEMFDARSFANHSSGKTMAEEATAARTALDEFLAAAPKTFGTGFDPTDTSIAVAWIMWTSSDWSIAYSVGDQYNPDSTATGLVNTDVLVDGEGTYTVALDFVNAGKSSGTAFSALGINNASVLFPGYIANITSVKVNGAEIGEMVDGEYQVTRADGSVVNFYTTSDNDITTRVNLYNGWVNKIPSGSMTIDGDLSSASPTVIDEKLTYETIEVTFDFVAPENTESYLADYDAWAASVAK
ncbi:MAG: glycoside hydrolase family 5 protein [Lachnospiraceae bacterium]|nr:glycoside hydrolase family 5 protein [Lachnospiraceae bacterium]